jgi:hypothetical protein
MHIEEHKSGYLIVIRPVMVYMNFAPLMHIFWFGFYLVVCPEQTILLMAYEEDFNLLKC